MKKRHTRLRNRTTHKKSLTWLPVLLTAALSVSAGACAPEEPGLTSLGGEGILYDQDYFGGEGYILPGSHTNVVRMISITSELEPGVADGFDLDGKISAAGDVQTCNHGDLTDPSGREGIDNQLAKMWPVLEPLVGEAVEGLLQGAINEGRMLMMLELTDVDDLQNDDSVTFSLYRSTHDPDIGTFGLISPDQTFYYDYDGPNSTVQNVEIVDGELVAGPVKLLIPLNILQAQFNLEMNNGWVRITIREDGTFDGILAGAFHVPTVLGELYETNAEAEARLVTPIFESNADMGLEDGKCTLFSTAFAFEGTTAYVVRDSTRE